MMKSTTISRTILTAIVIISFVPSCLSYYAGPAVAQSFTIFLTIKTRNGDEEGIVCVIPTDEYDNTYAFGKSLPSDPEDLPLNFIAGYTDERNYLRVKEESYYVLVFMRNQYLEVRRIEFSRDESNYEFRVR